MRATLLAMALATADPAAPPATGAPRPSIGGAAGLAAIRPQALSARVRFLSSELLEGRETGTRGHEIAELYVATEMQSAGLAPAGADGSYLQPVPLRGWRIDPEVTSLVIHGPGQPALRLVPEVDFVMFADGEHSEVETDAPLVFAGYAISAPEYAYDDLKGADLRGKVAVVLDGAPRSDRANFFPAAAHAVYADPREKLLRIAAGGAAGVLFVYTPEWEEAMPWDAFVHDASQEGMGWLEGGRLGTSVGGLQARGVLSMRGFEKLLAAAAIPGGTRAVLDKAEAGRLAPQAWNLRARLHSGAETRELRSSNVAGLLKGSDPKLSAEWIVLCAHLDHRPVEGDAARSGAADNAPGVAVLLELGRAFAALPVPPRRSVLFLAVTGKEKGRVGSEFFARHSTVRRDRIAAVLDIDGAPTSLPFLDAIVRGAEDSTLAAPAAAAAEALGIELSPDLAANADAFVRSDRYSFAREGIPSISIAPGAKGSDAEGPGRSSSTRSRTRQDGWDPSWDWEALARFARLQFLAGLLVADEPVRPRWLSGNFFERFAARPAPDP